MTGPSRRAVFRAALAAGAAGVAGVELAGCSTNAPPKSAPEPPRSGSLGKAAQVPVGGGRIFAEQKVVVTQPRTGQFQGFSAICTHRGCTVAEVSDGLIKCPCHGSQFRVADGSVARGPAQRPLPKVDISVGSGGEITLG